LELENRCWRDSIREATAVCRGDTAHRIIETDEVVVIGHRAVLSSDWTSADHHPILVQDHEDAILDHQPRELEGRRDGHRDSPLL
jgi:hypothetical protein